MIGPVVSGKIIDTCCKLWSSSCYGDGACALYDIENFRFRRYAVEISAKCLVMCLYGACIWVSRNRTDWSIEDDGGDAKENNDENSAIPEKEELITKKDKLHFETRDPIVKSRKP